MQTFLPYPDFNSSAKVLDNKRLGKQRAEAYQILRTLLGESAGWRNHPAVKMWKGHEQALMYYLLIVCVEWQGRGFKDTVEKKTEDMCASHGMKQDGYYPPFIWMTPEFCASHRSNLLRKDPIYYGQFGWTEPPTPPYVWPIS